MPALAWTAHLYTATGAALVLFAALAAERGDFRAAFVWLAAQVAVDASDGWWARRVRVDLHARQVDGALLDNLVDYVAYVLVPVLIVIHAGLVPEAWAMPMGAAIMMASAYQFSRVDAKTDDHFFTGFPSYWNIVAFYLHAGGLSPWVNLAVLGWLVVMVFVPVGYVYPSRTPVLQGLTVALGLAWGATVLYLIWILPDRWPAALVASLVFPGYYAGLSFALHARRSTIRRAAPP